MIVGDSFCNNPRGWPNFLHIDMYPKAVRGAFICHGHSGGSWWEVRKSLLSIRAQYSKQYSAIEKTIIIHPDSHRPCVDRAEKLSSAVVLPKVYSNQDLDERTIAASLYYKYFYSEEFSKWSYNWWLQEVENLLPPNCQILHVFVGDTVTIPKSWRGQVLPHKLSDIYDLQFHNVPNTIEQKIALEIPNQMTNHFTIMNNKIIAQELHRVLQGNEFDLSRIQKISS
jgi:hypothetical protein